MKNADLPLRFSRTLRFQIGAALLALIVLFTLFSLYTLRMLDEQRAQGVLLRLAGELQATAQHMAMQAMNYAENRPRDNAAYERDLRLYFQDLMGNTRKFDDICKAFSSGDFSRQLQLHEPMKLPLGAATLAAAAELELYWKDFVQELRQTLGEADMPHLSEAARLIVENNPSLLQHTRELLQALDDDLRKRARETGLVVRISFAAALVIATGIMFWFYRRVIRPLDRTVQGFREVATGNFSHRLPVESDNELGLLATTFNQTTSRLDTLFRLTARLQEGSDLDETLEFVAREFPQLLPLDWVGALFVANDGLIQLEGAYSDGKPEQLGILRFPLANTLLQECLENGRPLHIPDVHEVATLNSSYRFLRVLAERHRRDAIFLPVATHGPLPGVLVFATRQPNAYRQAHLELLANLATVITLSFGRTLKLAEHARLAAIGQFITGIAHEIRTPLATVGMALDYFREKAPSPAERQRLELAQREMARIDRLLSEVLLYARPLSLKTEKLELYPLLERALESLAPEAGDAGVKLELQCEGGLQLTADPDRLLQILLNLVKNAIEAAAPETPVILSATGEAREVIRIAVHNRGEPIPEARMEQLFEPFFTTRANGTGLGLAIVRRLVEAHGGNIRVDSARERGTTFEVLLPGNPG